MSASGENPPTDAAPPAPATTERGPSRIRVTVAASLVGLFVLAALFGPMLLGYDAVQTRTGERLLPPGTVLSTGELALLGTDQVGRDVLSQVMQGARISMTVGVATVLLAGTIGTIIGVIAAYVGGAVDSVLMRIADIQLAFPAILLAILIAAVLGPSVTNVIITLAIARWVTFARVVRSSVLSTKGREYVDSARVLGASHWRVIGQHILPAAITPLVIIATVEFGLVIIAEASLSFLGLGTPPGSPSWGLTIANGRDHLATAWWISTMPGLALAIVMVSVGMLGDELRDRLDPNLR